METKYSDLELAINTLVTEFHSAADGTAELSTTQFQSMISKQLPAVAKGQKERESGATWWQRGELLSGWSPTMEDEDGLGRVLQEMGVESGQNISFQTYWNLINKQSIQVFGTMYKEKNVNCTCQLQ